MDVGAIFLGFLVLAIVLRLLAGAFDGGRVEGYLEEKGCTLVEKHWSPFGPGWFGEKDSRIYRIVYRDPNGNLHEAYAKTSMLSGVYLTHDRIIRSASPEPRSLDDEKERLLRRLAEIERLQGRQTSPRSKDEAV